MIPSPPTAQRHAARLQPGAVTASCCTPYAVACDHHGALSLAASTRRCRSPPVSRCDLEPLQRQPPQLVVMPHSACSRRSVGSMIRRPKRRDPDFLGLLSRRALRLVEILLPGIPRGRLLAVNRPCNSSTRRCNSAMTACCLAMISSNSSRPGVSQVILRRPYLL